MTYAPTLAVYYEHPDWFRPLFAALERRGIPYHPIRADQLILDPATAAGRYDLFVNRMSPSAWERGQGGAVFFTTRYLEALEAAGTPVLNGSAAYRLDIDKSLQVDLLAGLGLPVPRTRVAFHPDQLPAAASELAFPLLAKPNVGGNGAGIVRFETPEELRAAVDDGSIVTGPDGVFLLQEYHPPRGRSIVRVETVEGRFLYAIRLHLGRETFSLCPADVCSLVSGQRLEGEARAGGAGNDARVERFEPSPEIVAEVESIARAGALDVGGVEYLESERDGRRYYYDVNALSNFIAEPEAVLGFDPTEKLVDALAGRLLRAVA